MSKSAILGSVSCSRLKIRVITVYIYADLTPWNDDKDSPALQERVQNIFDRVRQTLPLNGQNINTQISQHFRGDKPGTVLYDLQQQLDLVDSYGDLAREAFEERLKALDLDTPDYYLFVGPGTKCTNTSSRCYLLRQELITFFDKFSALCSIFPFMSEYGYEVPVPGVASRESILINNLPPIVLSTRKTSSTFQSNGLRNP